MMAVLKFMLFVVLGVLFHVSDVQTSGECSTEPEGPCSPFKVAFNNALESSPELLKQFDVTLPTQVSYKSYYEFSIEFFTKMNATNVKELSQEIAETATAKINDLSPIRYADFYSTGVEHTLNIQGALTPENAAPLALKTVEYLNKERNAAGRDGSPRSNLKTMFDAVFDMVSYLGSLSDQPSNPQLIADSFLSVMRSIH